VMNVYKDDNILAHKLDIAKNEGIQIGEKKGKAEGEKQAKIEVAKNLLKADIPISIISESTGLTTSEIEKLR
ncbi:MAG: transposase, partial [Wolbachia endosymbiont of Fragariocoptes setiger]|nr:transposase [Wolbachia endosymbiont of Fragariocoptes setiger]